MKNMFMTIIIMMMIPLLISMFLTQINLIYMIKMDITNILNMNFSIDMMMDWMSLMFLSTVMLISSLIILFSKYYIPSNEQKQFMLLLMMFVLSMSILILSNNILLILLGWDGLGLSSYILVVYYQNFSSSSSGTITILSNRIGDILILLSISLITLSSNWNFNMNMEFSTLTLILLMIASCSKSAQFPFSAWLPMAMAAPTPISALVHSSTLVTAGVYMMLRLSYIHPLTMLLLMIISSSTALYASMSANWEQDLKKIIALSTLSQIAMMMFAISLGYLTLAFLHLIIHALFKSAMFLCAGIMIHESSYQDMRMMGMNFTNYPLTISMLGLNNMALMGIPFMSGFFSKDMIIENMLSSNMNMMLITMMMMSIGMTASYSLRMSWYSNKSSIKSNSFLSNHQSIYSMTPIILLSTLGLTSGSWLTWLLIPDPVYMITYMNKNTIIYILIMGMMLGFMLQFKNKKYIKMGISSISLWFTHYISVIPTKFSYPLMNLFHNNDKTWQENYGPEKSFNLLKMYTKTPETLKSSLLMMLILLTLFPFIMM